MSRRSSWLTTLDPENLDLNNTPKSSETSVVSMMPSELDAKIAKISTEQFKYYFIPKLEYDIMEDAISIFLKIPNPNWAECILLISAFMVHSKPEMVYAVIKKIDINNSNFLLPLSFIEHHLHLLHLTPLFKWDQKDFERNAFGYVQQIEQTFDRILSSCPLRFLKFLANFEAENSAIAMDIFSLLSNVNHLIISLSFDGMADFSDRIIKEQTQNCTLWHRFWELMTTERGPWNKALPVNARHQNHFKRDFTLCNNLFPLKQKKNTEFNDHKGAAFLRDTGNEKTAQQLLEKYKRDLAHQYDFNEPFSLLQVIEDKTYSKHRDFLNTQSVKLDNFQCIVELPCEIIKTNKIVEATFSLFTSFILLAKEKNRLIQIDFNDIYQILLRTRYHLRTGFEIITTCGITYMINFPHLANYEVLKILKFIKNSTSLSKVMIQTLDFKQFFATTGYTEKWVKRKISNFKYLMILNMFSGRTFKDPSQYPVMPWVLSDYSSKNLDLTDPKVFRDLSKPIGGINEERLRELQEKTRQLKEMNMKPYLYSSGYICPLSIYHWLVREEPFTQLHIELQSGTFDHTARQFLSIPVAWNKACNYLNNFRELIPEFFITPEFLTNDNHFDLGIIDGKKVDNVELPAWASSPIEFIYLNRKAMESNYVSDHLEKWIDLIWGEKQTGKKAEESNNLYLPEMYESSVLSQNKSQSRSKFQIEAILSQVGQVPPQLFESPHPSRSISIPRSSTISKIISIQLHSSNIICADIKTVRDSDMKIHIQISILSNDWKLGTYVFNLNSLEKLSANDLPDRIRHKPNMVKNRTKSNASVDVPFLTNTSLNKVPPKNAKYTESLNESSKIVSKTHKQRRSGNDLKLYIPFEIQCPSESLLSLKTILPISITKEEIAESHFLQTFTSDNSCIFMLPDSNEVHKIKLILCQDSIILKQRSDIVCIASEGNYLALSDNDSNLTVFKMGKFNSPMFMISSFSSLICSIAISSGFHSVIAGTHDGFLLLCSLNNGTIIKSLDLEKCHPIKILITPAWGFIIVYLTQIHQGELLHFISVYSINGILIMKKEIDSPINAWCTYKTYDDFDYVVYVDEKNNFYSFEAFYLNISSRFYQTKSRIISLAYDIEQSTLIALTVEGKALFIPYENDNV